MKEERIKVVWKRPGDDPVVKVIPNELEELQRLVGGWIEALPFGTGANVLCHEEGRILGLPENVFGLCGPIVFVGVDGVEFASIPEDTERLVLCLLKK